MTNPSEVGVRVHVLDTAGQLGPALAREVEDAARSAADEAAHDLGIAGADLVICDYRGLALPEIGVGGYSPGAALAVVGVEPWTDEFRDGWRTALPATIAHELHHVRRWQGPGYGRRLIDSLVSEGLATLYETEVTGTAPCYASAFDLSELEQYWREAQPLLERVDQHARWFFGVDDLPRWVGYGLGVELAKRYCAEHGTTPGRAADAAADAFAESWR